MATDLCHCFFVIANRRAFHYFQRPNAANAGPDLTLLDASNPEYQPKIKALCQAWEALRARSNPVTRYNSPVAFLRHVAAAEADDDQPFAMVLGTEDDVSAVAIGSVENRPVSNTIGKFKIPFGRLNTLYIGESCLLHGGDPDALRTLLGRLMRLMDDGLVDLAKFHDVVHGSDWHAALGECAPVVARSRSRSKDRWQTQVLDPVTLKRLEHHSGKTRRNIRLRDKMLVETFGGDVTLEKVSRREQVDTFFDEASRIVSQSYHAALGIGVQAHKTDLKAYLCELADEGALRAYVLRAGGRAIAYAQGDLHGGVLYLWSTSYLPEYRDLAPGIVLTYRIIETLAEEGVPLLDFGWGDNAYKQRLGSHKLQVLDIRVYGSGLKPRAALAMDRLSELLDAKLRKICAAGGWIDRLRVAWRKRLVAGQQAKPPVGHEAPGISRGSDTRVAST